LTICGSGLNAFGQVKEVIEEVIECFLREIPVSGLIPESPYHLLLLVKFQRFPVQFRFLVSV
jgi:hypothetical protein